MKRLLGICALAFLPYAAAANPVDIKCPGGTTLEMIACAERSWKQSYDQLRQTVSPQLLKQWHDSTREVCAAAYAPYKDGTIYTQLFLGCEDQLNRELLKQFNFRMGN